jgi:hypothetical protein
MQIMIKLLKLMCEKQAHLFIFFNNSYDIISNSSIFNLYNYVISTYIALQMIMYHEMKKNFFF